MPASALMRTWLLPGALPNTQPYARASDTTDASFSAKRVSEHTAPDQQVAVVSWTVQALCHQNPSAYTREETQAGYR